MTTLYRLVTVAEAREQLSILDTEDDGRLDRLIIRASQDIMAYVNVRLDGWTDTSGLPLVDNAGNPQRVGGVGTLDTDGNFVLTLDTNGDPIDDGISIIPGPVEHGALVLVARMDKFREGEEEHFNENVKSLLWFYHQAVLA